MPRKASSAMSIGVGATQELSLRLSVASLARVLFKHPQAEHEMLALERTATLREAGDGPQVTVKAQPFGGAVRLRDASALQALIGDFHFDSERSRSEGDFRIQIRPSDWEMVKRFCLQNLQHEDMSVLEAGPERELAEEFADALKVKITSSQYGLTPMGHVIENAPAITHNIHAAGHPTVRIYNVFAVRILDPSLARAMLANSEGYSDQDLQELALQDARRGGKGRANAILALPVALLTKAYLAMSPGERDAPVTVEGHYLDGNVPAVLEGITVPKFQRL
ncbi:MAG: hypothetical protein P8186_23215 [Anaerolineae bacterium]|jgi:hypothetical protein